MEKKTFIVSPQVSLDGRPSSMKRFTEAFNDIGGELICKEYFSWKRLKRLEYAVKMFIHMLMNNTSTYIIISQAYVLPFFRKRQIVVLHDLIQIGSANLSFNGLGNVVNMISLRRGVASVWPVSLTTKRLAEFYRIKGLRDPIGVPSVFKKELRRGHMNKEYDLLWIGTLAKHKRFEDLIELARLYPELSFAAVVPGYHLSLAHSCLSVTTNIKLFSRLSDTELTALYRRSNNFISTSMVEGFGMIIMGFQFPQNIKQQKEIFQRF